MWTKTGTPSFPASSQSGSKRASSMKYGLSAALHEALALVAAARPGPSARGDVLAQAATERARRSRARRCRSSSKPANITKRPGWAVAYFVTRSRNASPVLPGQDEGGAHVHLLEQLRPGGDLLGRLGVGVAVDVERGHLGSARRRCAARRGSRSCDRDRSDCRRARRRALCRARPGPRTGGVKASAARTETADAASCYSGSRRFLASFRARSWSSSGTPMRYARDLTPSRESAWPPTSR